MSDPCAKGGILAEKRPRITWFESLQSASSELPALKKGTSGGMTQKLEEATLASAEKIAQEMLENQAEGHTSSSVNTILHTLNLFPEKSGVLQLAKKVGKLKGKGAGSLALPELRALLSKYPEKPQDHDVSNIDECLGKFKVEHLLEALNKCRDQQVLDETKLKAQQALHLHFKLVKDDSDTAREIHDITLYVKQVQALAKEMWADSPLHKWALSHIDAVACGVSFKSLLRDYVDLGPDESTRQLRDSKSTRLSGLVSNALQVHSSLENLQNELAKVASGVEDLCIPGQDIRDQSSSQALEELLQDPIFQTTLESRYQKFAEDISAAVSQIQKLGQGYHDPKSEMSWKKDLANDASLKEILEQAAKTIKQLDPKAIRDAQKAMDQAVKQAVPFFNRSSDLAKNDAGLRSVIKRASIITMDLEVMLSEGTLTEAKGVETMLSFLRHLPQAHVAPATSEAVNAAAAAIFQRAAVWLDEVDEVDFDQLQHVLHLAFWLGSEDEDVALSALGAIERFTLYRSENGATLLQSDVLQVLHRIIGHNRAPELVSEAFTLLFRLCDAPAPAVVPHPRIVVNAMCLTFVYLCSELNPFSITTWTGPVSCERFPW
ncbi:unnamed protein product [Durusdinium trenchii]|uniref:Uncharacterized protein n=1 Tax=Durusdinium trenchii TaxID=1381693 RepID=A0ABP0HJF0_9DINO